MKGTKAPISLAGFQLGTKIVRPRLLEQGAVECLFKPFSDTSLLEAGNSGLRPK
jgi:hypothetical protein